MLVNDIKFEALVFAYLRNESIFVCVDHFKTQKIGSLGFVIKFDPNLIRKEIFVEEVVQALKKVPRPCTSVVADWLQKYGDYYAREENKNPVHAFTLTQECTNLDREHPVLK